MGPALGIEPARGGGGPGAGRRGRGNTGKLGGAGRSVRQKVGDGSLEVGGSLLPPAHPGRARVGPASGGPPVNWRSAFVNANCLPPARKVAPGPDWSALRRVAE